MPISTNKPISIAPYWPPKKNFWMNAGKEFQYMLPVAKTIEPSRPINKPITSIFNQILVFIFIFYIFSLFKLHQNLEVRVKYWFGFLPRSTYC